MGHHLNKLALSKRFQVTDASEYDRIHKGLTSRVQPLRLQYGWYNRSDLQ